MSHHQPGSIETRAARRERLRLLCAADRTRLRLVWRMPSLHSSSGHGWASGLLQAPALGALLPMMPGSIGRWSRRLGAGARVLGAVFRAAA